MYGNNPSISRAKLFDSFTGQVVILVPKMSGILRDPRKTAGVRNDLRGRRSEQAAFHNEPFLIGELFVETKIKKEM